MAAPTTPDKERKRLLRTLVGDVTLISEPGGDQLRIGIRWRSGACEELRTRRPQSAWQARRTPPSVIELAKPLGCERTNAQLADELNRAGFKTGTGRRFDSGAVSWMRYAYQIEPPRLLAPGDLSVQQVAARLGIAPNLIYDWIERGLLAVRQGTGGRLCLPFTPEVEQILRQRIANSNRIKLRTQNAAAGGAV